MTVADLLFEHAEGGLRELADAQKAVSMAAYLKTEMPFFGVQRKPLDTLFRSMRRHRITNNDDYRQSVLRLWHGPEREFKYLAIRLARHWKEFVTSENLDLYATMIRSGAWWDLVDEIAVHLIGPLLMQQREEVALVLDEWIEDDDLWVRRSAIISQIALKDATDAQMLFSFCLARSHEKEFFIRKAIGWSLRQYSYIDPDAVGHFIEDNQARLSGLSTREGTKQLKRTGWQP